MTDRRFDPADEGALGAIPDARSTPTLDVPVAARLLGCSPWCAYELIKKGEWPTPVLRLGRRYRVPTQPLLDLLGVTADDTSHG